MNSCMSSTSKPPMKFLLYKRDRQRRRRLVLLVRILIKYLEGTNNVPLLHRVKAVVRDCTKRYRLGDTSVSPLQDAIESRLQIMVEDHIWDRVVLCLELHLSQSQDRELPAQTSQFSAYVDPSITGHQVAI